MDLMEFLQPGHIYPVDFKPASPEAGRFFKAEGRLALRKSHGFACLSSQYFQPGFRLILSLKLRGFRLDRQKDILAGSAADGQGARLDILGEVKNCRRLAKGDLFALRLTLLGRIID